MVSLNQVSYAQNWNPPVSNDVVVTPAGSLGIGVANPTKTLQVAGTVQFDSLGNNSGKNYLIYADSAGNLVKGPALEKPGESLVAIRDYENFKPQKFYNKDNVVTQMNISFYTSVADEKKKCNTSIKCFDQKFKFSFPNTDTCIFVAKFHSKEWIEFNDSLQKPEKVSFVTTWGTNYPNINKVKQSNTELFYDYSLGIIQVIINDSVYVYSPSIQ